ncbi:MAG: PD40 domain-containing protein, partial [Planctomycetes bacterium]|nr:PD40 domain-containing protein [Planctomycetota bacterium]
DGLDRVENECLWKEGRTPVLRVWRGGQVHLAEGKVIWEPYTSITEPILSPNRRDVACIARDKNKTVVIAQGSKSDVITIYETSLGYTPSNQIGYAATVPTTDPTQTITGYFLDRTTRQLPGSGLGIVTEPPSFSEDGSRVAYAQVNAVCFDGAVGPSFLKVFAPRLSADGRALAYFARFGPAGVSDKNAKAALVIGITPGVKFDDVAGVPMMSRDGKTIAYLAKRGTKWLVVQGTRPGPEYDLIKPRVYDVDQPVVSPDGKVVAYTAERGALQAVVVNGKEIDTQPNLSAPFLSADGKNVSYGFVTGPYFIWKTQPIPR